MVKNSALIAALRLLSRRNYFSEELSQKLRKKGYELEEIAQAVATLIKQGYLNDQVQLDRFVAAKRARGYGPAAIQWHLRGKSTAKFAISLDEEIRSICLYLDKRDPDWRNQSFKESQTQIRALQRRGFSLDAIMKVYSHNFDNDL